MISHPMAAQCFFNLSFRVGHAPSKTVAIDDHSDVGIKVSISITRSHFFLLAAFFDRLGLGSCFCFSSHHRLQLFTGWRSCESSLLAFPFSFAMLFRRIPFSFSFVVLLLCLLLLDDFFHIGEHLSDQTCKHEGHRTWASLDCQIQSSQLQVLDAIVVMVEIIIIIRRSWRVLKVGLLWNFKWLVVLLAARIHFLRALPKDEGLLTVIIRHWLRGHDFYDSTVYDVCSRFEQKIAGVMKDHIETVSKQSPQLDSLSHGFLKGQGQTWESHEVHFENQRVHLGN